MRELNFKNEALITAMMLNSNNQLIYEESSAGEYDPLKPRIMGALTKALTKSDLQDLY